MLQLLQQILARIVLLLTAIVHAIVAVLRAIYNVIVILYDGTRYVIVHLIFEPLIYSPIMWVRTEPGLILFMVIYACSYVKLIPAPSLAVLPEDVKPLAKFLAMLVYNIKFFVWLAVGLIFPNLFLPCFWEVVIFPLIGYYPKGKKNKPSKKFPRKGDDGGDPKGHRGPRIPDRGPTGPNYGPIIDI